MNASSCIYFPNTQVNQPNRRVDSLGMPVGFVGHPGSTCNPGNQIPGYTPLPNVCYNRPAVTGNRKENQRQFQRHFGAENPPITRYLKMTCNNTDQLQHNRQRYQGPQLSPSCWIGPPNNNSVPAAFAVYSDKIQGNYNYNHYFPTSQNVAVSTPLKRLSVNCEPIQIPYKKQCLDQIKMPNSVQWKDCQNDMNIQGSYCSSVTKNTQNDMGSYPVKTPTKEDPLKEKYSGQNQKNFDNLIRPTDLSVFRVDGNGVCSGENPTKQFTRPEARYIVSKVVQLVLKYMPHLQAVLFKMSKAQFICFPDATCSKLLELFENKTERLFLEGYIKYKTQICHITNNNRCMFNLSARDMRSADQFHTDNSSVKYNYCISSSKSHTLTKTANAISGSALSLLSSNSGNDICKLPYPSVSSHSKGSISAGNSYLSPIVGDPSSLNSPCTVLPEFEFRNQPCGRVDKNLTCIENSNYQSIVEKITPPPQVTYHKDVQNCDKLHLASGKENNSYQGYPATSRPRGDSYKLNPRTISHANFTQHAASLMKLPETVHTKQSSKDFIADDINLDTINPTYNPKPVKNSQNSFFSNKLFTVNPLSTTSGSKSPRSDGSLLKTVQPSKKSPVKDQNLNGFTVKPTEFDVDVSCFAIKPPNGYELMKAIHKNETIPDMSCFSVKPQHANRAKEIYQSQHNSPGHILSGMALPMKEDCITIDDGDNEIVEFTGLQTPTSSSNVYPEIRAPNTLTKGGSSVSQPKSALHRTGDSNSVVLTKSEFQQWNVDNVQTNLKDDNIVSNDNLSAQLVNNSALNSGFTIGGTTFAAFTINGDELEMKTQEFGIDMLEMLVNAS